MRYLRSITLIIIVLLIPVAIMAQKKTKKVAKPVAREDYSQYVDNPICKVIITDSLVMPVTELYKRLSLPKHMGHFFSSLDDGGRIVYENEFNDQRYFAASDTSGHHNLYRQILLNQQWSEPELVRINGEFLDIINPLPMPDGQTLYFSARTESDNDGNSLSIYTTTFDSSENSYLAPQKLPFPFNSNADDLYYIEDEMDSLALLITTRNQPLGKVCVYTMRNKQPWVYYDTDDVEPSQLKSYALIERISDTWPSEEKRNELHSQIMMQLQDLNASLSSAYEQPQVRKNIQTKIREIERQLDEYRLLAHKNGASSSESLRETIIEAETQLKQLYQSLKKL